MKTATIETEVAPQALRSRVVSDFAELVKARLTLLVLLTTAVGFYLGAEPPIDYKALFQTVFGTAAAAAGAAALNQWWERRADALMRRTKTRPIPAGRMAPLQALVLGTAWMCREDYLRAGFRMISSDDSSGERSASQSVFFCILLLVLAGLPAFVGVASYVYQPIELLLGGLFVAVAMRFLRLRTPSAARVLFFASIAYLPLLLAALVLTKL